MKRVLVLADLHCGHRGGLTPPGKWRWTDDKFGFLQETVYNWFITQTDKLGPLDRLVINGDAIDGKGEGSGGTELLTTDRHEQCKIAAECINRIDRKKTLLIRGTPYHTGKGEDWEDILAGKVAADHIGWHEWLNADGVIFDFKHKVGRSEVPYGRLTAPSKETVWNILWQERGLQPDAKVIVRSHVHYFVYGGDGRKLWMTTPALQAWSKYGTATCSGTIDLGMIYFECNNGEYKWRPILLDITFMKAEPLIA